MKPNPELTAATASRPIRHRRIWHSDWLVARSLRAAIAHVAGTALSPGTIAVDLGCGDQPYGDIVAQTGATYLPADIDEGGALRIDAAGRVDLPAGSAGAVLSFQVLEHVRDLGAYLGEARRLLAPDGCLILSTHGTWLYHPHPEDHRRWTREGLVGDLAVHGFRVDAVEAITGPLAWTTIIRLTSFAFALRRIPLVGQPLAALLGIAMNMRAWVEERVTPDWVRADNACVYLVVARVAR